MRGGIVRLPLCRVTLTIPPPQLIIVDHHKKNYKKKLAIPLVLGGYNVKAVTIKAMILEVAADKKVGFPMEQMSCSRN